jgi:hypothetical protein
MILKDLFWTHGKNHEHMPLLMQWILLPLIELSEGISKLLRIKLRYVAKAVWFIVFFLTSLFVHQALITTGIFEVVTLSSTIVACGLSAVIHFLLFAWFLACVIIPLAEDF